MVVACSSHSPDLAVEWQTAVQYHAEDLHLVWNGEVGAGDRYWRHGWRGSLQLHGWLFRSPEHRTCLGWVAGRSASTTAWRQQYMRRERQAHRWCYQRASTAAAVCRRHIGGTWPRSYMHYVGARLRLSTASAARHCCCVARRCHCLPSDKIKAVHDHRQTYCYRLRPTSRLSVLQVRWRAFVHTLTSVSISSPLPTSKYKMLFRVMASP